MRRIIVGGSTILLWLFCSAPIAAEFEGISCQKLSEALPLVAISRDMGMSKQDASSMLPAQESPLKSVMLVMLDELYGNTDISSHAYMSVKLSQCEAEKAGKSVSSLTELKPLIQQCQNEFGAKAADSLSGCIAKIGVEKAP